MFFIDYYYTYQVFRCNFRKREKNIKKTHGFNQNLLLQKVLQTLGVIGVARMDVEFQ